MNSEANFGGIENMVDPRTEVELVEHSVKSGLEDLLNRGCLHVSSEIHEWLGRELRARKALQAAE